GVGHGQPRRRELRRRHPTQHPVPETARRRHRERHVVSLHLPPGGTIEMRTPIIIVLGLAASCAGLTCDQNKKESIVRMNAGIDFLRAGAYPSAEKELEAATSLDQSNHQAAYALGQVYAKQRNWEKAGDAYSLAVKFNAEDAMYHYKLGEALF